MGARGPRAAPSNLRQIRAAGHRRVDDSEPQPFECGAGPAAIEAWLRDRHRWRPGSGELVATFAALNQARETGPEPSVLVKIADAQRRLLRDLGCFDDITPVSDGTTSPARLLG